MPESKVFTPFWASANDFVRQAKAWHEASQMATIRDRLSKLEEVRSSGFIMTVLRTLSGRYTRAVFGCKSTDVRFITASAMIFGSIKLYGSCANMSAALRPGQILQTLFSASLVVMAIALTISSLVKYYRDLREAKTALESAKATSLEFILIAYVKATLCPTAVDFGYERFMRKTDGATAVLYRHLLNTRDQTPEAVALKKLLRAYRAADEQRLENARRLVQRAVSCITDAVDDLVNPFPTNAPRGSDSEGLLKRIQRLLPDLNVAAAKLTAVNRVTRQITAEGSLTEAMASEDWAFLSQTVSSQPDKSIEPALITRAGFHETHGLTPRLAVARVPAVPLQARSSMKHDQQNSGETLHAASEAARRYVEMLARDPGCQAVHGRYRKSEILAAAEGSYCPACQHGGCEQKREAIACQERGGERLGEQYAICHVCLRPHRIFETWLCRCCDRCYFVCRDCQEGCLHVPLATPTKIPRKPSRITGLASLRLYLDLLRQLIERARR